MHGQQKTPKVTPNDSSTFQTLLSLSIFSDSEQGYSQEVTSNTITPSSKYTILSEQKIPISVEIKYSWTQLLLNTTNTQSDE